MLEMYLLLLRLSILASRGPLIFANAKNDRLKSMNMSLDERTQAEFNCADLNAVLYVLDQMWDVIHYNKRLIDDGL